MGLLPGQSLPVASMNGTSSYGVSTNTVSATAYNGTVNGGVTIVDDKIEFNGVDGNILCSYSMSNSAFSYTSKFTVNSLGGFQVILDARGGSGSAGTALFFNPSGNIVFRNGAIAYTTSFIVTLGQTYIATVTFNGSDLILYIDGVIIQQETVSVSTNGSSIGLGSAYDGVSLFLDGSMEYTRIYDKALTPTEITETQNGTLITDGLVLHIDPNYFEATDIFKGTVNGGVAVVEERILPDGTTGYLSTNKSIEQTFTYIFNVNKSTGTGDRTLIDGDSSTGGPQLRIDTNNRIVLNKSGVANIGTGFTGDVPNGIDSEVAVTYDGISGDWNLFVNGTIVNSGTSLQTFTAGNYGIFRRGNGSEYFDGSIKFGRVYNRELSPSEIENSSNGERILNGMVMEFNSVDFEGTPSSPSIFNSSVQLPTSLYDIKPFTPYTPVVMSAWFRLGADVNGQRIALTPYMFLSCPTGKVYAFYRSPSIISAEWTIGTGNTDLHNVVLVFGMVAGVKKLKIYGDGELIQEIEPVSDPTKYQDNISLGADDDGSFKLDGQIGNVKILTFTDMPSDEQIAGLTRNVVSSQLTMLHNYVNIDTDYIDMEGGNDLVLTDVTEDRELFFLNLAGTRLLREGIL